MVEKSISAKDFKKVEKIVNSTIEFRGYEIYIPGLVAKIQELQKENERLKEKNQKGNSSGYW